jgi:hypothetical protein
MLGLTGFNISSLPTIVNTIEGGSLRVGLKGVPLKLGSAFSGTFNFEVLDSSVSFDGNVDVVVKGLANGKLQLQREASGLITGKVALGVALSKSLSGSVDVAWDGVSITGIGKVGYQGEKFSGNVIMQMMERNQALQLAQAKQAPPDAAVKPAKAPKPGARIDYAVFGEGDLNFAFNEWLNGTAHVIIDPKGNLTVIGKITPQKEFILFPQKDYIKPLFKFEARASYGIPVVGNIFIFANVGMDLFAKLGPAKFYKIVVDGTYSTDPAVAKSFSISGSLNISAAAGARLRAEAGAGLEILSHDIKAGAGINGIAGIKAYAEATPVIGYREKAAEGQDMKGEWFIRGDLEVGAQPFLGLSGDLFVEISTPWWSPLSDKKWTWPLFSKEWPLGGNLGMLVSVDYVFGSGQWPKFDLKPVPFDSEKFVTGLYNDSAKSGPGKELEQPGKWQEKNSAAAQPPPKTTAPGNAKPGKPDSGKAKSKAAKTKKIDKPVDPNAQTKAGSVKDLQAKARKQGKGPPEKAVGKDAAKVPKAKDDPTKAKRADRTVAEKERDLRAAVAKAEEIANSSNHSRRAVRKQLSAIKREFNLSAIELIVDKDEKVSVKAEINPFLTKPLDASDEPELRSLLLATGFFGSSPTDIDRIVRGVRSDGNGDAVFQFIKSKKFTAVPGYKQLLQDLKLSSKVHSVYMALEQANRFGANWISRMQFEQKPTGGGDVDLAIVGISGTWSAVYQFKGVKGLGNIASNAAGGAHELRNVPASTMKVISIEVRDGTYAEFLASANPALGHEGYMGGIKAFKAANPTIRLKVAFSDGTVITF